MSDDTNKPVILAVDDTPENLDVVKGILAPTYIVKAAINGPMALKIVERQPPDLILLDVNMPGMDGFEVCGKLKESQHTRHIPVIFVTALDDHINEEKGFKLGAVDYIRKPFKPALVKARVRLHLRLALHQRLLELLVERSGLDLVLLPGELEMLRQLQLLH